MKVPCALWLQNLEKYSFLIGASCYSREIWRYANGCNRARAIARRAFNAIDGIVNNICTPIVFSYCKLNHIDYQLKNSSKLIITLYMSVVEI
jgi:hypothetical protein